jgi:CobQ-like glutamine amidotransferase family enzyme
MTSAIVIARILPDILGINGSAANAEILAVTFGRMGIPSTVVDVAGIGDQAITPDVVCVGSGSTSGLRPALTALVPLAKTLTDWARDGVCFLAVGMGWDVLGKDITLADGQVLPGVGLYPSSADYTSGRYSGEVLGLDYRGRETAGYINQVGYSFLHDGSPLLAVTHSATAHPPEEGIVAGQLYGTRLGGPVLSLNPHLRDDIIEHVAARRGLVVPELGDFHTKTHALAAKARQAIASRLGGPAS